MALSAKVRHLEKESSTTTHPWYWALAGIVWLGLVVHTLGGDWSSDFAFHSSAIAEFAAHPFSPLHVHLPEQLPHHSLSFYHQVLGLVTAAAGVSAITMTKIAGILNATALLLVFPRFIRVFLSHRAAPMVSLLLVLLAWGPGAWRLSGVLNLNSLGFGLPYPSYFTIWLSMLVVVWISRISAADRLNSPAWLSVVGLGLVGFVASNAHAISFGAFCVVAAAVAISRRSWVGGRALLGVVAGAAFGALAWPYFPLLGVADESSVIDWMNRVVYEDTLIRLAPSLLGVVVIATRLFRDRRDPLALSFLGLLTIYLSGLLLGRFVFGRVLGVAALILQIALAGWLLEIWEKRDSSSRKLMVGAGAAALVVLLLFAAPALVRMVPHALLPRAIAVDSRLSSPVSWIEEFDDDLGPGDVVIAPESFSKYIPVTGAKVVSVSRAPFIEDYEARSEAVDRFFDDMDYSVLSEYDVGWVAFDVNGLSTEAAQVLGALDPGETKGDYVLIAVQNLPGIDQ